MVSCKTIPIAYPYLYIHEIIDFLGSRVQQHIVLNKIHGRIGEAEVNKFN